MTRVTLTENVRLINHRRDLRVTKAVFDLQFPPSCTAIRPNDPDVRLSVHVTVDVEKDNSPVRTGGSWVLLAKSSGQKIVATLVPVELVQILPHETKFRRYYVWHMFAVGVLSDPFDWFPKPMWQRRGPQVNILEDLSEYLRSELGDSQDCRFDSEGGFRLTQEEPS